jgi:D-alanyl-D-alanine carboxypeptidase/D-alanyl-D-alanine-endopeptidase (penicillin-binding protein 4)
MRERSLLRAISALGCIAGLLAAQPTYAYATAAAPVKPAKTFTQLLDSQFIAAGGHGAAIAMDLKTGRTIWSRDPSKQLIAASLEKLFTTASVLGELGFGRRLSTTAVTSATVVGTTLRGDLFLKGGGDPTLDSDGLVLIARAVMRSGIRAISGRVMGDDGFFDSLRGVPATGSDFNSDIGGALGGLTVDHGDGAKIAADRLAAALRRVGVAVGNGRTGTATAPVGARQLAKLDSPTIETLIKWTNVPSDNFYAETLLKDLGAIRGGGGTTAAGLRISRAHLAGMGLHPVMNDGSGLSYENRVSPLTVEHLLAKLAGNSHFTKSLAIAGQSGTIGARMTSPPAFGHCRAKTGTLTGVSNLAGYCDGADGGTIVFALMMNGTDAYRARPRQDAIVQLLAGWHRPPSWH